MDTTFHTLPSATSLSASILTFLDDKLRRRDQLERASDLSSELETRCGDLDRSLLDLNHRLQDGLVSYTSYSDRIGSLFGHINSGLTDLHGREGLERSEKVLGEELPSLAKKVARVETVRKYAETALKLDTLVGDIEDAVSSTVSRNLRKCPGHNSEQPESCVCSAAPTTLDFLLATGL